MYSCIECGDVYETDGRTKANISTGAPYTVFAMIWTCPDCTKKDKCEATDHDFEERFETLGPYGYGRNTLTCKKCGFKTFARG